MMTWLYCDNSRCSVHAGQHMLQHAAEAETTCIVQ